MTEQDRRLNRISFPVEAGHIMLFARAVGDPNPVYRDPEQAAEGGTAGIVAPPTFTEAANHFDETWPYRPHWGRPWLGSAAEPTGLPRDESAGGTDMHAETHYVYHRPLRPGMTLSVAAERGREWTKHGPRSGRLNFHEIVSRFADETGAPVTDCTTVVLRTEHKVTPEAPDDGAASGPGRIAAPETPDYPRGRIRERGIAVGHRLRDLLVENLSRAQIIQYAGVSGDFSPQHVDEIYNTQVAGYPTVFAHGMLTMGMLGRVATDFLGDGRLTRFGFQFRRQVWPGDSLLAGLEVTELEEGEAPEIGVKLTVTNQHGQSVGTGYARARLG